MEAIFPYISSIIAEYNPVIARTENRNGIICRYTDKFHTLCVVADE